MKESEVACSWLLVLTCLLVLLPLHAISGEQSERSPAEWTDAEMERFLLTAEIRSTETIDVGVTQPRRAVLESEGVTHDAQIQTVDIFRPGRVTQIPGQPPEVNFKDTYKFNIAAYRLDRLIGLDMVPVYVERRVGGRSASIGWWVDDLQMMELERIDAAIEPPDVSSWNQQMANARLFMELVYNTDPNFGNILITNDWQIRLVDFTRAFRTSDRLRRPRNVGECIDPRVYEGLQALNEQTLETVMEDLLTEFEINGLLARRDLILEIYGSEMRQRGEADVLCTLPWH